MIIKASLSKGVKYAFVAKLTIDFITFSRQHAEKLYFGMSPNRVERHKYKSNILFCILFFFYPAHSNINPLSASPFQKSWVFVCLNPNFPTRFLTIKANLNRKCSIPFCSKSFPLLSKTKAVSKFSLCEALLSLKSKHSLMTNILDCRQLKD